MGLYDFGARITVGHEVFEPEEALLITLCKLAFPSRFVQLTQLFNRHESTLSRAFNFVVGLYKRRFDGWIFCAPDDVRSHTRRPPPAPLTYPVSMQ